MTGSGPRIRVTEVLAAISLTTDLASGVPIEKGLQTCLVATALARLTGGTEGLARSVFQAALLRAIGCTAQAPENTDLFEDDIAFQAALKPLDPGDPEVFAAQLASFGHWAGPRQDELRTRFAQIAAIEGPRAVRAGCEVSRALGTRLDLDAGAVAALDQVYERWDGLGNPDGLSGEAVLLSARIVHCAEQAVLGLAHGGLPGMTSELGRRAGGHLDPELAELAGAHSRDLAELVAGPDLLQAVLSAEPLPHSWIPAQDLDRLCLALAVVADLKGRYLVGHSMQVAALATRAAQSSGLPVEQVASIRAAALLHDLGRVAVPTRIWDHPGPLGPGDTERVRLHSYWTARVLERVPSLAPLSALASCHHERLDGSGYHRGVFDVPPHAGLIAAADILAGLLADRPHRPAADPESASAVLRAEAHAGRLDRQATAAILHAAGLPADPPALPFDLTARELQVIQLAARGLSNRDIADRLGISARTAGHHLAHVYDKTGRRTRAGVAVLAMEHGLLDNAPRSSPRP